MSVQLCVLRGDAGFDDYELMAPDFDIDHVWLWRESDGERRIDLSRKQMLELRDKLTELLGRF